ncbi:MAG: hypothetical protein NPIRA04_25000 [Nitrospirales bacterium]|nr:MAG: hypothetical protein NPIRA04_25000 [Nitrospirales bacterium]
MGLYQHDACSNRSSLSTAADLLATLSLHPLIPSPHLRKRLVLALLCLASLLSGCSSFGSHYQNVESRLLAGNPQQADQIILETQEEYGQRSHLLYLMDRGMTLHLAGRYQESNTFLEEADMLIEDFYTTRIRDETAAILLNETQLPYQGDPYEQVMVNVIKALNYARLQDLSAALVEARRIDHRLNVIADTVDQDEYREDPFARYLTGMLYEASGDLNNAFIAYRKAEEGYRLAEPWSRVLMPSMLKDDLLRITKTLRLTKEFHEYRLAFPNASEPLSHEQDMAQIVVISLNGRGPTKTELLLDFPISLDALTLIALTKRGFERSTRQIRGPDAVLYGLQGEIVRVALPRVLQQSSPVAYSTIRADNGVRSYQRDTQRMYDLDAVASKNLDDESTALVVRAVARAAMKMAAAVGIGYGTQAAVNKQSHAWVALVAVSVAKILAILTEEADIRTWRTLPGEIQVTRLWVPPGTYDIVVDSYDTLGKLLPSHIAQEVTLKSGESHFLTQRILK